MAEDRMPINNPPNVQTPVMKYVGLRFSSPSIFGRECHTKVTKNDKILPYKYPIAAVMNPTNIDAFAIPPLAFTPTPLVAPPGDTLRAVSACEEI
mmetsp:Transcript_23735/g.56162  ORF Transcript_23735/g.56162 Transcript_23735/m.56162 type:complete len:95 (-) Transcript_23735:309-593(-)